MRICHLAASHTVFSGRLYYREARSARRAGLDVTIIAVADALPFIPPQHGCRVIPLASTRRVGKVSVAFRLFCLGWCETSEVYHCHDLASLMAGIALKLLRHARVIYDAHEDYPRTHSANMMSPGIRRILLHGAFAAYEWPLARFADAVLTVDPLIARRFRRTGVKAQTLPNLPRLHEGESHPANLPEWLGRKVFIYAGALSRKVALLQAIAAVDQVRKWHPEILLVLIGGFPDMHFRHEVQGVVRQSGLQDYVEIREEVPMAWLPSVYSRCFAGLILYAANDNYGDRSIFPVKLMEYMAAGLPILASSFRGLAAVLRTYRCGLVVDPNSPQAIASVMMQLLDDPQLASRQGRAARQAFEARFHWESVEPKLFAAYGCSGILARLQPEYPAVDKLPCGS